MEKFGGEMVVRGWGVGIVGGWLPFSTVFAFTSKGGKFDWGFACKTL